MASLKNIENMISELTLHRIQTTPKWIKRVDSTVSSAGHVSGQLREAGDLLWDNDGLSVHELNDLSALLGDAAEQFDDAHEEWLEHRIQLIRSLRYE